MRILLTGGAGFIGSHLAQRLLRDGHGVTIVDNLSTGVRDNVPAKAAFVELDLARTDFTTALPSAKFDAVCHFAAQSSGPASADIPLADLQTNAASTLLLSRWCIRHDVRRFVYASSMAVYGNVDRLPAAESTTPCRPQSYYGVSKLSSEYLLDVAALEGLNATSLRFFSVYGPGQNLANLKQGIASIYLAYLLEGREVPVTGSLDRFRDLVYIDDVVDACVDVITRASTPSRAYNIGTGTPTTVRELLAQLIQILGLPPDHPIRELAGSPSDQFGLYASVERAETELGWRPSVSLDEGLSKMIEWAKSRTAART